MTLLSFFSGSRACGVRLKQQRARLLRVAYAWCHNRALAEDLVQETLARAVEKCSQLRESEQVEPWLFAILTNCWRDHLRRLRPQEDIDELEEALLDPAPGPDRLGERGQIVDRVRAAVARLPLGQREVLTLVDLEDFSYAEVSGILDIPIGTVMSRLCRARQSLKKDLIEFDVVTAGDSAPLRRVK
ncbi:RNA polymerase sigma-70 factor (ECF subfamily) [Sulfuritortus calidifontis]|uniref:RNA polymerase sigma-70 factor (ECF subfamily) n=1 Tax=Sulfuritortus calidifontis TaxID=1914471 RepID=A0A4R3JXB8_9PROT|nr:RNA polymerase sigma factor [Sulfuritortus calidifontis]TCS72965.1 RNA polymerase sigma-70 factor (ECF subfamily) [Sulfuritortus calidifontis]